MDVDGVASRLIPAKVRTREPAIVAVALVAHGDMRLDLLVFDEPTQELARALGGVGREPLWLEIETPLGAIDHRLGSFDLAIGACGRCFDVDDDSFGG